ncbi:uncharacterized protein LY89DRAFT_654631 [Mollisia scopiformis]|uniref:Uncharacterized protein n=1 Tax=Mollisia scopiformis TaxID=149040 RepID=A0A194WTK2_MOLSC|nr:uncharacterized protein LY89DRAFT_654631 [Mollisia scopiformis]KUJ11004.1 hypothetical protein LY89DRAFT_654631 [Mollisia scopiformis]
MISTNSPLIGKSSVVVTGETRQQGALSTVIADHFEPPVLNEKVKLDKVFNARNLQQICGIKIRWTSNLADYLMMRNDDTAVEIFHCAAFLRCHENSSLFPKGFIEETIQTLAILLPEHNKDVKTWFKSQQKLIDTAIFQLARECGQLKKSVRQIKNFVYWHDRLLILKQVFDEAEPSTASQWWNDRRKKVQWCTFWVAALVLLLTIFFGLLQGIEGALQVYKAFNP